LGESIFSSNRDTLLVAIPFFIVLVISAFRLDQIIATPRIPLSRRRPRCGIDESGEPVLRDPDGKLSQSRRKDRMRG
jgi:hypothetical protein